MRNLKPSKSRLLESVFDSMVKHDRAAMLREVFEPAGKRLLKAPGLGLDLTPGQSLCDVGCGLGAVTREARRITGPGPLVTGIDISERMIAECRRQDPMNTITYRQLDIAPVDVEQPADSLYNEEIDEPNEVRDELRPDNVMEWGQYDNVISVQSIFYMPDTYYAMRQHIRLLKQGGNIVVAFSYFTENGMWKKNLESGSVPLLTKLASAYNWNALLRRCGVHTDPIHTMTLPDGDQFLVLKGTLTGVSPTPTPSDTLLIKHPTNLPKPVNLWDVE